MRLHEGFVGARSLIGTPYLATGEYRAEYEREIAPRTEEALTRILTRIYGASAGRPAEADEALCQGRGRPPPRRCLDLGAGTGAATRAVKAFFGPRPEGAALEVVQVDRVPADGMVVADLSRADALPWLGARFDLVVEAHLLNELFLDEDESERARRIAGLVRRWGDDHLHPDGVVVLLEPALRETSRLLLAVRDELLASGDLHVLAPCLTDAPCPARARPRDWCHDSVPAAPGAGTRVDFSYVALARRRADVAAPPSSFRVVSDRLEEKGRTRVFGCGPAGRVALIRLDKHASAENAAFGELARGDRVSVEATTEAQDGLRVLPGSAVRREPG